VHCLLSACVALALAGCEHDVVLPDQVIVSTCGDGITEADEECDVASPGCIDCQVQPEWTCTAMGCNPLCADGVVGGPSCTSPHRDTACDMTGFWAVRETVYLRDDVLQEVQVSSNWYLYEISQTGDDFEIDAQLDCGTHVTGTATVDDPPASLRGLIWLNSEDGTDPIRGKRHGTSTAASGGSGGCAITLDRWYFARGVTTAYLPASFASEEPFTSLAPLPSVSDAVTDDIFPAGATDPTTSGIPGIGTVLSGGFASGIRYAAERTWASFATTSNVPAGALSLVVPGAFDLQENVLRVIECGDLCSLLIIGANPATNAYLAPTSTFQFIGKTLGSARVSSVVTAAPRQSLQADLATCQNVQLLLPHDPTAPVSACPSSGGL
jgi:hypothetical protein